MSLESSAAATAADRCEQEFHLSYPGFHSLPPGLRLRAVQPLLGRDGSCPLVHDLERSRLVEVPMEFQYHAAVALETGNLDDDLVAWLAGEDVLTYDNRPPGRDRESGVVTETTDTDGRTSASGPMADLDRAFFFDGEVHCRLGGLDGTTAVSTVESVLARAGGAGRVIFHFTDDGTPAGDSTLADTLRRAVAAVRRQAVCGQWEIDYELISDGRSLGAPLVRFLAENGFRVRLTAPELPALDLLLNRLPERLTLSLHLDTEDRLIDLWQEAKALGVPSVEAVKITDRPFGDLAFHESELRRFRHDLFDVCDDMFAALESGREPLPVYEPLARVVGRYLAGRPLDSGAAANAGYMGVLAHGELFPLLTRSAGAAMDFSPCESCWARELCVRGTLAGPAADPRRPQPRADRCEFWRAEVEVGLLFYHRLAQADPTHLYGFAHGREEPVLDPYSHRGATQLKAC